MVQGLRNFISPVILAYTLLVLCIGTLLGPALAGRERLAFRDVSHFYTPLYGYVASRQAEDWFPLWNPLDLTGMPLAGETTTAVFYPIRVLVYAVAPTSETAIAWYVVLHLLIAAVAVHVAARSAGAGQLGCAIAILTYPLAGPIFFLIYNPPFLVGAAWMPIAIAGGLRLLNCELHEAARVRSVIASTGIALAMPVLGGDPQSVVHVLFLGAATWLLRCWRNDRQQLGLRILELRRLAAAIVLGGVICAPQLAASLDWSQQSDRVLNQNPADRYDFSVPPWHWLELIVPAASGRLFPTYERISHAIPGDGRTWVMTLYAGLVPIVLMFHRLLTRRRRRFDLWDYLVPIGLVFSIGSIYELIVLLVPGYDSFRYPGKWLPFVALGLAVVAARQAESLVNTSSRIIQSIRLFVSLVTITVGLLAILASRLGASDYLDSLELVDRFWGSLQPNLAFRSIAWSGIASTLIACGLWGLIRAQRYWRRASGFALGIVGLIACDLFVSVRHQVATVAQSDEDAIESKRFGAESELIKSDSTESADASPTLPAQTGRAMRTSSRPQWPSQWLEQHDGRNRLLEVEASQRMTRFGRWHLADGEAVFNSVTSLRPQRIDGFWSALASSKRLDIKDAGRSNWPAIEKWLGIDRHIATTLPSEQSLFDTDYVVARAQVIVHPDASPIYRWDSRYRQIAHQRLISVADWETRLLEVSTTDVESPPMVESDNFAAIELVSSNSAPTSIELVSITPEQWTFRVATESSGLLTVKSYQDGNWRAVLRSLASKDSTSTVSQSAVSESSTALRVDYLFMGAHIPPGRWEIEFIYRPWWLIPSLTLAACGAILAVVIQALQMLCSLQSQKSTIKILGSHRCVPGRT